MTTPPEPPAFPPPAFPPPPAGPPMPPPMPPMYPPPSAGGLNLPPGVVLASSGRRIGAFFLSYVLVIVTLVIGYIIWGLIAWSKGTTPALQVLGMKVWHPESARPASWGRMALREIIGRIVDGILSIITELISFIFMLTRDDRRTLHDLVASTVVVHDPNKVLG
jgi:uncharacterized RDD family membrane protein YckC